MILPSIDLQKGHAVQLVGGERLAIDAGPPMPLRDRFAVAGEIAVVDLDAAMSQGDNQEVIFELLRAGPARVGGGIRDIDTARRYLDGGATRVIIGTRATPEFLQGLPPERVCVALDAREGEVVVEGWRTRTGASIEARMAELRPYASAFLVTFVEREGRLGGTNLEHARRLVDAAQGAELTIAGGVTTPADVAALDAMGARAQIGMALYTGQLELADALVAPLAAKLGESPWPTVVVDEEGQTLGLVYSSARSVREAVQRGIGVYESRRRGLWVKGESSGNTQALLRIDLDCDRDALRFMVRQAGRGFCHQGTWSCFGPERGLPALVRTAWERKHSAPEGSYTARLYADPALLAAKLREEAAELAQADTPEEVAHEAADVLYFLSVKLAAHGVDLAAVHQVLDRRSRRITRRPGDAKPEGVAPAPGSPALPGEQP